MIELITEKLSTVPIRYLFVGFPAYISCIESPDLSRSSAGGVAAARGVATGVIVVAGAGALSTAGAGAGAGVGTTFAAD